MSEEFATYRELHEYRRALDQKGCLDYYACKKFASSMLSSNDVALLESSISRSSVDDAADAVLLMWTHGGVRASCSNIQRWLIASGEDDDMGVSIGVVLEGAFKEMLDGTALRLLFEFAHNADLQGHIDSVRSAYSPEYISRVLEMSRERRIREILDDPKPQKRREWILRGLIESKEVVNFLENMAARYGSLQALASLAFRDQVIEWSLFESIELHAERAGADRFLINLTVENVRRGAALSGFGAASWLHDISAPMRIEFEQGLETIWS